MDIGIYFYGARFYDPYLNRFIQPDTIIPGAGNPQAWDRYAYAFNSPIRYVDPTGHNPCDDPNGGDPECPARKNKAKASPLSVPTGPVDKQPPQPPTPTSPPPFSPVSPTATPPNAWQDGPTLTPTPNPTQLPATIDPLTPNQYAVLFKLLSMSSDFAEEYKLIKIPALSLWLDASNQHSTDLNLPLTNEQRFTRDIIAAGEGQIISAAAIVGGTMVQALVPEVPIGGFVLGYVVVSSPLSQTADSWNDQFIFSLAGAGVTHL